MTKDDLKKVINEVITKTFARLEYVYQHHREIPKGSGAINFKEGESRLVFPMYGEHQNNTTRISEQELRFAFVETFNEYCKDKNLNLFYSVETPTKDTYSGFANGNPKADPKGRSAEFDLVVYNEKLERVCLIEFKAKNADTIDHTKDFCKLDNQIEGADDVLRFFVEILKSYNTATVDSLKRKIEQSNDKRFVFRCYALEGKSQRDNEDEDKSDKKDISDKFER